MLKQMQDRRGSDEGFTLIELLIAIVVVGILSTVVVLGIGGLTNSGQTATCKASRDAAQAASTVYYANTGGYAATYDVLTAGGANAILSVPAGATAAGTAMSNGTWTVTLGGGGAAPTTFAACP